MNKETMKSTYFFGLGIFSIYSWNSILNLNNVFAEIFENPNISKIYTIGYFLLSFPAFIATVYIDRHYSIYKSIKATFITNLILFDTLFLICTFMPLNTFKYILFFFLVMIIGNCDILIGNLGTSMSMRFHNNESSINFLGKAFSGLICNSIMIVVLCAASTSKGLTFFIFLIFGNIFLILFLIMQERFFSFIRRNQYMVKKVTVENVSGMFIRR